MLLAGSAVFQHLILLEKSDLDVYISTCFLGSSKKNIMELSQEISNRTITDILLLDLGQNVDELGSADSYLKKSSDTFVKPMIVGEIIGANFITMVGSQ